MRVPSMLLCFVVSDSLLILSSPDRAAIVTWITPVGRNIKRSLRAIGGVDEENGGSG